MNYLKTHIWCWLHMLQGSIIFSLYATVAVLNRLVRNESGWKKYWRMAMEKFTYYDYSNSVTTRATILLTEKLHKSFSSVPNEYDTFIDMAIWLSYRDVRTFNKYRELLKSNDARAILDVFYVQAELDEGVYKALLDSKHKVYVEINAFLESIGHPLLNLERLDNPFIECIFVPIGTTIDGPLLRKAICIRSDGYLKVGEEYTIAQECTSGWVNLVEEPFMSYKATDFKFSNNLHKEKGTIIDPLSSTI